MEKPAVVNLGQKHANKNKSKQKAEVIKFFASKDHTQFNMSIEFNAKDKAIVNEFSIGFVLTEQISSDKKKDKKSQSKIDESKVAELAIFYNFINIGKIKDYDNLEPWMKFAVYKNVKSIFYGVQRTDTSKVHLKAEKSLEILLLIKNIYSQIKENEEKIKILQENKKSFPYDVNLKAALKMEQEQKSKLKAEFINMVKNFIKKYF